MGTAYPVGGFAVTSLDAEAFSFLHAASMAMAAVEAAGQLGMFCRLAHGPADLPTLIVDCCIGPRGALLLLTALEQNVARLHDELSGYHPNELIDAYLADAEPRRT